MFRLRAKRNVWRKLWRLLIRRRMKSSCSDTESHAASDPMQSLKMFTYHLSRQRYLPHVTNQQLETWRLERHGKKETTCTLQLVDVWWVSAPEFALIVLIISPKNEEHWKWCTERLSVLGGAISVYSVSCMSNVIFNPSLLNWSSLILTVAHIYICIIQISMSFLLTLFFLSSVTNSFKY